jgi:hypothetical protein
MDKAQLGIDTEAFFQTRLGKSIVHRANAERFRALLALAEIDATDTQKVVAIQNEARLPVMLLTWLKGFVQEGREAEIQLQENETE